MFKKYYTSENKFLASLEETRDGNIIIQKWIYANDTAPFCGGSKGITEYNFRLADQNAKTYDADLNRMIELFNEILSIDGIKDMRTIEPKDWLEKTNGFGTLDATTIL